MRFAKFSRTLLPLAIPVVLATCAFAQEHPNVTPNSVRDQLMKQETGASQPQAAPQAPAEKPASEPIKNTAKAPAKTKPQAKTAPDATKPPAAPKPTAKPVSGKPPVTEKAPAKAASGKPPAAEKAPAKAAAETPVKAPAEKPAAEKAPVARRDPFDALLNRAQASNSPAENLPPGKAGLVVSSLRIDGIVNGKGGMIAIVSNPQQRVYFLREGDKLYDGAVDHITLEAISFHEFGKDAFGKPLERQVTKRLYPSPGEQQ